MEPEHEMIDVGRHVGGEAADHIARRAEDYCEYERQRIELANEARINALHVEGARLTKCVCQLEERLRLMTNGQVLIAGGISDAGETLGSADLYDTLSGSGANLSKLLVSPRHDQTATLLPDGTVQLWGGLGPSGISIDFGEVFDPTTSSFRLETTPFQFQSSESPALEASIPENNSENVASNTLIALRFSKPLQVSTVNSQTVALADSSGTAIACQVVPAEGGILAFITPQSSLLPGTTYTITVNGASDVNGIVLPATSISFTTSQPPPKSEPTSPSNDFWTPLAANFQPGHWRSGNGSSPNQLMPALHAAPGVTALAGQTLRLNGEPLREVTVSIGSEKTITDETGRFLLPGLPAGHQVLLVDGTTASRQGVTYCIFQVGVDVTAGKTNVLNYTIWMTAIDKAHEISIPSPTTTDTVVSTPLLPGLELHIPPNTVNGHQTTYTYNSMDRLATRTDPLSNTEIYYYDGNGNLTQFADRRGKVTQYAYDGLNRRTLAKFGMTLGLTPYESSIAYNYDAGNRLTSAVDSIAGTITPTFDSLDRLTEEATPQGSISYAYDAASRRTTQTVAGQTEVAYTYDNANRLTQITQGTPTVSLAYDDANRRTSLTLPNGVVVSYGYDAGSQLTGLTYTNGGTTLGNLTYSYDLAGRRTSVGGSLAAVNFPIGVGSASYNADNRLTQWGTANLYYDANGNMTSDGINSYVWDGRNHLASMDSAIISFQYDGYGRRSGKTISGTSTNYLYDGANAVQELSGTTPTANLLMGSTDEYFTRTDSSGTANFLTDAVGSTVALTNSSGSALASYVYEPFGNATLASGSSANPYQYTGRENDGTGLYYYRARYYAPTLGRFISEDPIGFNGGGANLYAYAGNSPTNLRDPSGQNPCLILGLLGTMVYNSHVIYNSLAGRKVVYYSGWSGFGHILAGNAAAFGAGCSLGFGFGAFGAGGAAGTAAGIGAGYGLAGQATSDALSGNFSGVNTYAGAAAGGAIGGMAFEADPAIAGAVAGSVSDLTTQGLDDISTGAGGLQVVPIMSKGVIGGFAGGMFPDSVVPGEGSLGAFDSGLRGAVAGGVFDAAQRMANGN
jgi:RHS repeat-associated protein